MTTRAKNTDPRRLRLVTPANRDELVAALVRERHGEQADLERERFANTTTERAA